MTKELDINKIDQLIEELKKSSQDNVISKTFYKTVEYAKEILELSERSDYIKGKIEVDNILGKAYFHICDYDTAQMYFLRSLKEAERSNDNKGMSFALNNVGIVLFRIKNYRKALEYYNRSLELKKQTDDFASISTSYNNIGLIYNSLEDPKRALDYFLRSLKIDKDLNNKPAISRALNNIGIVYKKLGDIERSLKSYEQSYNISKTLDDKKGVATALSNLSTHYLEAGKFNQALEKARDGVSIATLIDSKNHLLHFFHVISRVYEKQNSFKKALEYFKKHSELQDKIISEDSNQKLIEMQTKYESDKKEKETEIFRLKNEELSKINETKDKLFRIIHHDLLNPFSAIQTTSEMINSYYDTLDEEKRKRYVKMIYDSSTRVTKLMNNLFEWAKTQSGQIEVNLEIIDLNDIINQNIDVLNFSINNKSIKVDNLIDANLKVYADINLLDTVIRNILSNAIKFTYPDGEIKFYSKEVDDMVLLIVQDTGMGIAPENIENIFNVGSRLSTDGTANEKGTGLGLILSKEFMQLNKGDISVESELGKGSKFIIELPQNHT
ncbi:MAG: tetratricopeptide repeat-containing sensor histidine kinase [Candidatus Delongbacteria bacterium]|jgi:signal transduction histidine kinase|nr:tetratricopeptide repeat-containing sensor histidine kinase [Candidatus Delongbacteria bacterium]